MQFNKINLNNLAVHSASNPSPYWWDLVNICFDMQEVTIKFGDEVKTVGLDDVEIYELENPEDLTGTAEYKEWMERQGMK